MSQKAVLQIQHTQHAFLSMHTQPCACAMSYDHACCSYQVKAWVAWLILNICQKPVLLEQGSSYLHIRSYTYKAGSLIENHF